MKHIAAVLLLALLTFVPAAAMAGKTKVVIFGNDTLRIEKIVIDSAKSSYPFNVEIAETEQEQIFGLMNRTSLPSDGGMLFVFKTVDYRRFWMKDTLIPLDMLFIDAKGKVVKIHENALPKDTSTITSGGPVLAVLEVAGGTARGLGLKVGDVVHYKAFGNERG